MKTRVVIPDGAKEIISSLRNAGYEAYVVGGCVRDSILGKSPHDWDICTSATPEQVKKCLTGRHIIETGIKHGTVTVLMGGEAYEVTTYRRDGAYSDHRRPDTVEFVPNLREDLARRDFTINAMAYNDEEGVVDLFGGMDDLSSGTIRCVGDADTRFEEDALRVLRALRFASTYGFKIADDTADAIHRHAPELEYVARERIFTELGKLLLGDGVLGVLLAFSDVIAQIIPKMKACVGFAQNNSYHCYTVYDHIVHSVAAYEGPDLTVKLALLLHDIGKPLCYSENETGGHFYDHARVSRDLAKNALDRFKVDNQTRHDVPELVLFHDAEIQPTHKSARRWLNRIGEVQLRRLLEVRRADVLAHSENNKQKHLAECAAVKAALDQVLEEKSCFSVKDLAVSGKDIMALGVPEGREVGRILQKLMEQVMDEALENSRESLLGAARADVDGTLGR